MGPRPRVQFGLLDLDQRHVRGGESARAGVVGVAGEHAERFHPVPGQFADRGGVEDLARVGERGAEAGAGRAVGDDRVDVDDRGGGQQAVLVGAGFAPVVGGQPTEVARPVGEVGGDPAQVVEADLRGRGGRRVVRAEVAQDAVADPPVRHREQLFLDRFEQCAGGFAAAPHRSRVEAGQVERHRVHAGEPADRTGQVGPGDGGFLAPVTFQADQGRGRVNAARGPPRAHRHGQRDQQSVVDPAPVDGGQSGQHRRGDLRRHPHRHPSHGVGGVDLAVQGARAEQRIGCRRDRLPVGQFRDARARVVDKSVRPSPERGAHRGQRAPSRPGGDEIADQDAPRHPVDDVVTGRDDQRVGPVGPRQPGEGDHPGDGGIEAVHREFGRGVGEDGALGGVEAGRDFHAGQQVAHVDRARGQHLERVASVLDTHPRAQHVVMVEHRGESGQHLLGFGVGGQREHHLLGEPAEHPSVGQVGGQYRGRGQRPDAAAGQFGQCRPAVAAGCRDQGQSGDRALFEHVLRGEVQPGGAGPRDQLDRQDAVAARGEERIPRSHSHAQDLREQFDQLRFDRRGRRVRGRRLEDGRGQFLPVQFPVGRQRDRVEDQDRDRHRVRGQGVGERTRQLGGVECDSLVRQHIGHENGRAGRGGRTERHRVVDRGVRAQRGVDLAQLDAEAADLDLEIGAAQIVQRAVRAPAHQIAGPIHPRARVGAERVGHEAIGGEGGAAEIAAGQRGTGQIQFAAHPGGHRAQSRVQHHRAHPGQRGPDGDRLPWKQRVAGGGQDGGLGGAVAVVEGAPAGRPAPHQTRAERVARDDHPAQRGEVPGLHRFQRRRRDHQVADRLVAQQRRQFRSAEGARRRDDQGRARAEGEQQFQHRHVETRRTDVQHPRARVHPVALAGRGDQGGQTGVGDHHALGASRGPRGVEDVGGVVFGQRAHPVQIGDGVGGPRLDPRPLGRVVEFQPVTVRPSTAPESAIR